jgi:site-specific recombinase XerD
LSEIIETEQYNLIPYEINEATKGLTKGIRNSLLKLRNQDNALTIARYILVLINEVNIANTSRETLLRVLPRLSEYCSSSSNNGTKLFKQITKQEFQSYLNSLRKPEELDPLHKWIGTYNLYLVILSRFFKWLYNPELPPKQRPKPMLLRI